MNKSDWGKWLWKKYKRTSWMRETITGVVRAYYGTFVNHCEPDPGAIETWHEATILFWSKHPALAMKNICLSGKDPAEFEGKEI